MRTFDLNSVRKAARIAALSLAVGLTGAISSGAVEATNDAVRIMSPDDAVRQGVTAYNNRQYGLAIPSLQHAAERNIFLGQYYLARIYGDNDGGFTDHAKAFLLFQQIARDFANADPEDPRAIFVADALVELAGYVRRGLPEAGVLSNRRRAAEYLNHAALYFDDEDAKFELAKLMLHEAKDRGDTRTRRGLDWLSIISQRGHAGAQAFLADLMWRGKFTKANPVRALALITVAAKNAPHKDAFWIDDIFQNIFCGASEGVRTQATGLVAEWDSRYGRKPRAHHTQRLEGLSVRAIRTCADGREVPRLEPQSDLGTANEDLFGEKSWRAKTKPDRRGALEIQAAKPVPDPSAFMQAGAMGLGR